MCGRFALDAPKEKIEKKFGVSLVGLNYKPRMNIAPHQGILTIILDEKGKLKAEPMVWGFIPSWVKDAESSHQPINARIETASSNPYFRHSYKNRHCLIPVTSFYEWDKTTKPKTPYRFYSNDESLFALAGLWSPYLDANGNSMTTSAILTTTSTKKMTWLHDRMPVILSENEWRSWLDNSLKVLPPFSDEDLQYEKMSPEINSPKFEPLMKI